MDGKEMSHNSTSGIVLNSENGFELSPSDSIEREFEEGEIIQDAELICVGQEELERFAAEEDADVQFSSPSDNLLYPVKRKGQSLIKYHIVSCQDELEDLRKKNANEDAMIDPKDKLHLVKYVKIDGKVVKLWECGICAKDFRHQYTLMRHLPTHTDERKYICDVCNKAFRQMSTLSQHRAIHSNARPYVCEVCQKTFNRVSTLISHRKTHFDDKPHKCHECGKGFHQKGNLKNHVFSHTNERPYRCEVCGRGFNQMSNLVVHKFKSHGQALPTNRLTGSCEAKFVCQMCGQKFQKRNHLLVHEEAKHFKKSTAPPRKTRLIAGSGLTIKVGTNGDAVNVDPLQVYSKREKISNASNASDDGSTSGLLIDAIHTVSMQEARDSNQTAFALLKSIDGTPSLVKIFDLPNDKQLLIPASSEDLSESLKRSTASSLKPTHVKVAVVATVSQQMDEDGQLVVHIEPTESDDSLQTEKPIEFENPLAVDSNNFDLSGEIDGEQIQFVRPLPDGRFEILSEEDAACFLEAVEDESKPEDGIDKDSAQILITQDEDGQLMVEGTPLQLLLGANNQQQLQLIVDRTERSK